MTGNRLVKIDRALLLESARDVESVVVSLDRIGSWTANLPIEERDRILAAFIEDWGVFHRLAKLRSLLWDAIEEASEEGPSEDDPLERELHGISFWSGDSPRPPM